jgi:hypothetical protein
MARRVIGRHRIRFLRLRAVCRPRQRSQWTAGYRFGWATSRARADQGAPLLAPFATRSTALSAARAQRRRTSWLHEAASDATEISPSGST